MPKSKNRRKNKAAAGNPGATNAVSETVVAADAPNEERQEAAPKKTSVGPVQFFRQVRAEAQKVTWTSRGETMVSTIMVLIMVAIMSLFFFSVDQLLRFAVPRLLSLNLF